MIDRIVLALGLSLAVPGLAVAQDSEEAPFLTDMPCGDGSLARVWEVPEGLQLVIDGRAKVILPRIRPDQTGAVLFLGDDLAWGWSQDYQGLLYRLSPGEEPGSAAPVVCRNDVFVSRPAEMFQWTATCRDGRSLSLEYITTEGSLSINGADYVAVRAINGEPAGQERWQGSGVTLIWRDDASSVELIETPAVGRQRTTRCERLPD